VTQRALDMLLVKWGAVLRRPCREDSCVNCQVKLIVFQVRTRPGGILPEALEALGVVLPVEAIRARI
jgi:hypothetical protein